MAARVNFVGYRNTVKPLYFTNLDLNEAFKIKNAEAVYLKTRTQSGKEYMMEVATGRLWHPTTSEVVKIDVEVNVGSYYYQPSTR